MFKKAVEAKTQQRLSGADRKKLKRTIKERFSNASDAYIDVLLPPKIQGQLSGNRRRRHSRSPPRNRNYDERSHGGCGFGGREITVSKFPNRVHVYGLEGGFPMFFDVDGRGTEVFPTVYALWKVPELLPAFMLKGGEVSRFIIGGADVMFPGIYIPAEGLPSFLAGEPWAVKVPGNPAPIALGTTTMSSTEALKAGLRGKALRITHSYRDTLWASVEGYYVPNAGFLEDVVIEDPSLSSASQTFDSSEVDASIDQRNDLINDLGEGSSVTNAHSDLNPSSTRHSDLKNDIPEQIVTDVSDLKVTENVSTDGNNVEDQHTLSTEDVDEILDKCLLQALHTTVNDKDLPIPGSTLWSSHVLHCRPSGITLDIKKSSHKKLSKWLQSKSSAGLISVKEDKHKKEVTLFSVNRSHPDYASFKPEKRKVEKNEQTTDSSPNEGHVHKVVEVIEVYKPSVHVNPILASVGADMGRLYLASEATDVVFRYIEQENLVKPENKSIVVLDATLCDALYKGTVKKGSTYPTEIHKKDLGPTFISRMQAHHRVTRGKESVVRKGALKTIQLLTERRQGNKKVTKLSGLESFLLDPEALASELQKKFACSTSVAELPGKKGHEVLIQGGVIDDLGRHLIEQYGIPKRYIEVFDKTKK